MRNGRFWLACKSFVSVIGDVFFDLILWVRLGYGQSRGGRGYVAV